MVTQAQRVGQAEIWAAREQVAVVGMRLFERKLTDAAGGNVSVRVGDVVCVSPSYSGQRRHWQLDPEDVLVVDMNRNIIDGEGKLTREANVHFGLYEAYSDYGTAVIHAHPQHLMVFAALGRSMPPVVEATRKFGQTPVVDFAPAHSEELAQNVVASMQGREARITKHAAGTIAPWHGLFLMGKDLFAAFDAVERLDNNAYCIMMGQLLGGSPLLQTETARMNAECEKFGH